jgi:hypothetical protein
LPAASGAGSAGSVAFAAMASASRRRWSRPTTSRIDCGRSAGSGSSIEPSSGRSSGGTVLKSGMRLRASMTDTSDSLISPMFKALPVAAVASTRPRL